MSYSTRTRRSAASSAEAAIRRSIPEPSASSTPRRRALAKSVSYAEVPIGTDDPEPSEHSSDGEGQDTDPMNLQPADAEADDEDAEGEDDIVMEDGNDDEEQEDDDDEKPEQVGTPRRQKARSIRSGRGRGRPRGRGRGRTATRPARQSRANTEDEDTAQEDGEHRPMAGIGRRVKMHKVRGVPHEVVDDEVAMEDDEKGETKVDSNGRLLGSEREYRVTTFTLPERSNTEKLYMLGIDVAKAAGHTDSSLLARRYHSLVKAYLTDSEKVLLLETGIGSGSNFRNDRPVTIYAARNIYKYMGAAIIKNGRYVIDDYYEDAAAERCRQDGIDPGSFVPVRHREAAAERATRGDDRAIGAPFYAPGAPTTHWGEAGIDPWTSAAINHRRTKLTNDDVGPDNWMWKMAISARELETELREERKQRMMDLGEVRHMFAWHGQYGHDSVAHTNTNGVEQASEAKPAYKIPSSAKVEELLQSDPDFRQRVTGTGPMGNLDDALNTAMLSQIDAGSVVVETPKETLKRKRERARHYPAGQAYGVYEPHTNLAHVPMNTQPTVASTIRLQPLPCVTNAKGPGSRWTWPAHGQKSSIITGRTVGDRSRAVLSVEYVFEGPQDSTERDEEEMRKRLKLVHEAEEWERGISSQ